MKMRDSILQKKAPQMAYIYFFRNNIEVTKMYLDIIRETLNAVGYECECVSSLSGVPKSALIVHAVGVDAFRCFFQGYRNFILWQQGVTGEESFMRHHSGVRRAVLNFIDCFAMKKARMVFFVSDYMKGYYERLAKRSFSDKAYVMPCFNEILNSEDIRHKDYSQKIFAYVGSLDLWQCFDETAEIYARIERQIPGAFFRVLTFNTDKAEQILREKKVRNYSVACVPKEQVKAELANATYGFLLRQDIEVNRVATPTKLSSYLSAGVLPIYSPCLTDFHAQAEGKECAFPMDLNGDVDCLIQYVNKEKNSETIRKEIEDLFDVYYSRELHVKKIAELASICLK